MSQGERLAFNARGSRREVSSPYAVPADAAAGTGAAPTSSRESRAASASAAGGHDAAAPEPRDWAFTWTLVFTAVLFLRPQDVFPPLEALHLAEMSALLGLISLLAGRLS